MQCLFYDDSDLVQRLEAGPASIFLAGPTVRGVGRTPWRAEALELLKQSLFPGLVVLPEFRDRPFETAASQVFGSGVSPVPDMSVRSYNVLHWETCGIENCTVVLFWMPFCIGPADSVESLPGFTTRAEVSRETARAPHRIVLGMPPGALSSGHIRYHAQRAGLAVHRTLEETVAAALQLLGTGQSTQESDEI